MPFQDRYQKLKQGAESYFASSIIEEDLERKIDTITTYQNSYIKSIFTRMAHANPHHANILHDYIVAQKNEQNIKESTVEGIIKRLVWLSSYLSFVFGVACTHIMKFLHGQYQSSI